MSPNQYQFQMAIEDFQSAWHRALVQEILARLTGRSTQLLSYEEVAEKLKLRARTERGVALRAGAGRPKRPAGQPPPARGGAGVRPCRHSARRVQEGM